MLANNKHQTWNPIIDNFRFSNQKYFSYRLLVA